MKIEEDKEKKIKQTKQLVNILMITYFNIFALVLIIIILSYGFIFIVRPKYQKISESIKSSSTERSQKYIEQGEYLTKLKDLIIAYNQIDPGDINRINNILPKKHRKEKLFAEIESLVIKNGFLLTSLSINVEDSGGVDPNIKTPSASDKEDKKEPLPPEIKRIKLNINIVGPDYYGLKKLLKAFENNIRLMDINRIGFNEAENTVSLDLYTYYLDVEEDGDNKEERGDLE